MTTPLTGNEIAVFRALAGFTRYELGRAVGVSRDTIADLEYSRYRADEFTNRLLTMALGLAPRQCQRGELELVGGLVTIVDPDVFAWASGYQWFAIGGYAGRPERDGHRWRTRWLHREVVGASRGVEVHHRNRNRLDNRISNLVVMQPEEHRRLHAR